MGIENLVQELKSERDRAAKDVQRIDAALAALGSNVSNGDRRSLSSAARAKIAEAQRARWAKVRAGAPKPPVITMAKKRGMSVAARARIAKAQRARWAKVRASKKGTAKAR